MIRWWDFRQPCTSLVEHSQPNAPEHALQKSCRVFGRDHATKQTDGDHERSKLKRSWSNENPVKGNLLVWNEWLKFKELDYTPLPESPPLFQDLPYGIPLPWFVSHS